MPKLTKEEKKARKALKKLQKLREQEEERRRRKRSELDREIRASEIRKQAVEKQWRESMLDIKLPIFRQDIQVMWQTFERAYDKKEYLIEYLMSLMRVAEDQFQRAVASSCDTADAMILKFEEDLENLLKENEDKTRDLLNFGKMESEKLEADRNYAETHLQVAMHQGEQWATERFLYKKGINIVKADDERGKCEHERDLLRVICERQYTNMWDEYKLVLKNYIQNTSEIQKLSRRLRKKENDNVDIIAAQTKQLLTIKGTTRKLQLDLQAIEDGTQQSDFSDNRERHRDAFKRLRLAMSEGDKMDRDRLDNLVNASADGLYRMERARSKGEKILRLAGLCRKLETKREKVLPFGMQGPFPSGSETPLKVGSGELTVFDADMISKVLDEVTPICSIWEKIARAKIITAALRKEREQLCLAVKHQKETIEENKVQMAMANIKGLQECRCVPTDHVYHSDYTHILRYM